MQLHGLQVRIEKNHSDSLAQRRGVKDSFLMTSEVLKFKDAESSGWGEVMRNEFWSLHEGFIVVMRIQSAESSGC